MITRQVQRGDFWDWLKNSGSYKSNFSYEGANAVYDYFDNLSDDLNENIDFDPIAWCVEFSEYESLDEVKDQYNNIETLEDLQNNTTVIELKNGRLIVGEF